MTPFNLSDEFDSQMSHQAGNLAAMLEALLEFPDSHTVRELARLTLEDFHVWQADWTRLVRTVEAA